MKRFATTIGVLLAAMLAAASASAMPLGLRTTMWGIAAAQRGGGGDLPPGPPDPPAPDTCTVTFDANGGEGEMPLQTFTNGVEQALAANAFTRPGFKFLGWTTGADDPVVYADCQSVAISVDATLYAVWEENEPEPDPWDPSTIRIDTGDGYETEADGSFSLDLGRLILSSTTPTVTVKGLPAGIKFDSKKGVISGKATKPGVYEVTVSAKSKTVKTPVTAKFELVVPNLSSEVLPNLLPETDAYGVVMCGVALDPELVKCDAENGWSVKVAGIPAGLKYEAKTGKITGVPTKAGTFTVTFTATKKGVKGKQTATITLNVAALPTWATGTFTGNVKCKVESVDRNEELGFASMTVADKGKISGKIVVGGTNWTFNAASYARVEGETFVVEAVAKAGKATMPVALEVQCAKSALELSNGVAVGKTGDFEVALWRNMWKDKATAAVAKAELAKWEGLYTLSLEDGGYLSLTVGKDGNVKASGKLSDGTKVSATSPFVYDEDYGWLAYVYTAPSGYKGGSFAIAVGFDGSHGALKVSGLVDGAQWTSRNPQATGVYGEGFSRVLDFFGAYYGKKPDVSAWSRAEFNADSPDGYSFDGMAPKVSVAQATGIFKGSCSFLPDGGGKAKKANFEGIVVLGAESLRGFYLWDASSSYVPKTGKPKTYKYKESYGVSLAP